MGARIRVATYNLYLGADLELLLLDDRRSRTSQAAFDEVRRQLGGDRVPPPGRRARRGAVPGGARPGRAAGGLHLARGRRRAVGLRGRRCSRRSSPAGRRLRASSSGSGPSRGAGEVPLDGRDGAASTSPARNTVLRRQRLARAGGGDRRPALFGSAFTLPAPGYDIEATLDRGWCAAPGAPSGGASASTSSTPTPRRTTTRPATVQRDELLGRLTDDAVPRRPRRRLQRASRTRSAMPAGFVDAWVAAGHAVRRARRRRPAASTADLANAESHAARADRLRLGPRRARGLVRAGSAPTRTTGPRTACGPPTTPAWSPSSTCLQEAGAPDRERLTARGRS